MLINRTYRTWVYDYRQFYGLSKKHNGTHQYVPNCPNSINSLTTDISTSGDFVSSDFAVVNVNAGSRNNYIKLYEGDISGISTDPYNPFFGNMADIQTDVVSNGFLKISVNGTYFYIRKYIGPTLSGCATWMFGNDIPDSLGNFESFGFMAIGISNTKRFIKIYTLQ